MIFYLYDFLISQFKKKWKLAKNKINIYETKLFVSWEKNSNKNKYHSSNYISETKMKLSNETHSLQLNQYLKKKKLLVKKIDT